VAHETRMDQVISDCKYWMEKYSTGYKENEKRIAEMHADFTGRIETIFYQLSRRVTDDDMKKNFKRLNEMLAIKFNQVEDVK
jgi:hypothetical protein